MNRRKDNWPTVPDTEVYPEITAALQPGEQVYWQGRPEPPSLLFNALAPILLLGAIIWIADFAEPLQAIWQSYSLLDLLPFLLLPIAFCGAIIISPRYKAGLFRYALTSQRALSLRRGKIEQQASPQQLRVFDVVHEHGNRGFVRWRSADEPVSESRNHGFYRIPRAQEVLQLLKDWQEAWQEESDAHTEKSSKAFRQQREDDPQPQASTTPIKHADAAVQRIVHPQYGFSLDVPSGWDTTVTQNYDGPWRVLGVTLLKRIIRPGTPRPYDPGDRAPWNTLTIRGGASTGLNMNIHPPESVTRMPDEEQVLSDRWSKLLGVPVKFFEKDIAIAGFKGFAVVRDLPAGSRSIGFGNLPVPVLSRQWWLTGHDLHLEVQGIAPADSPTLQETIDQVVQSLRPR
ncbi:MAG: hypothetical protein ABR612_14665 [Chromatocurvus sp.]